MQSDNKKVTWKFFLLFFQFPNFVIFHGVLLLILVQFKTCCTLFERCGKVIELVTRLQNIYVHAMKMCNHTDRTTM